MKYEINVGFWYDENQEALVSRLSEFFRCPIFSAAVLKPRSLRLPPSVDSLVRVTKADGSGTLGLDFSVERRSSAIRGDLSLVFNSLWGTSRHPSTLTLSFAITPGFLRGPFGDVSEVRSALLAAMRVGPSQVGSVEARDYPPEIHDVKFATFRAINTMEVPASLEWVTAVHGSLVERGVLSLGALAQLPGVEVGSAGSLRWVQLTSEPFSYAKQVGTVQQRMAENTIRLSEVHGRFRRA